VDCAQEVRGVHGGRHYAVANGWGLGVYDLWAVASAHIVNFRGWVCKGFDSKREAEVFLEEYNRARRGLGF
jgi:viroplasmin and RNaseH domain-containing protein